MLQNTLENLTNGTVSEAELEHYLVSTLRTKKLSAETNNLICECYNELMEPTRTAYLEEPQRKVNDILFWGKFWALVEPQELSLGEFLKAKWDFLGYNTSLELSVTVELWGAKLKRFQTKEKEPKEFGMTQFSTYLEKIRDIVKENYDNK